VLLLWGLEDKVAGNEQERVWPLKVAEDGVERALSMSVSGNRMPSVKSM
jgi:hypothetical protein